jgi:DNA polymerase III epsilon subunit-like protein
MCYRSLLAASLVLAASLAGCRPPASDAASNGSEPAFVKAFVPGGPMPANPADAPDEWRLAFLDVETTGLVPGYHEMVDVGVVITDLDGNIVDSILVRVQPDHPERTSPEAAAINGFEVGKWRGYGALSPTQAIDSLTAFHRRVAGDRPTLMVAHNSHFDAAFLDQLFREGGRSWREMYYYYVLDIPSMAWMLGLRDLEGGRLAKRLGVEELPDGPDLHTGLRCATGNVRLYRALLAEAARQARG